MLCLLVSHSRAPPLLILFIISEHIVCPVKLLLAAIVKVECTLLCNHATECMLGFLDVVICMSFPTHSKSLEGWD